MIGPDEQRQLKRTLLHYILHDEINTLRFSEDPHAAISDSVVLRFVRDRGFCSLPLFRPPTTTITSNDNEHVEHTSVQPDKVNELFVSLIRLLDKISRATRSNALQDLLALIVDYMDQMVIHLPDEKPRTLISTLLTLQDEDNAAIHREPSSDDADAASSGEDDESQPQSWDEEESDALHFSLRKRIHELNRELLLHTRDLLFEIDEQINIGGLDRPFCVVRYTPSLELLPSSYRDVLSYLGNTVAPLLDTELSHKPKELAKLKSIYHLLPVRIIKLVAKSTNPLTLLKHCCRILVARPMGLRSILQRIAEISTEIAKTERQLHEARNECDDHISPVCHKIHAAIHFGLALNHSEVAQQVYFLVDPFASIDEQISNLSDEQKHMLLSTVLCADVGPENADQPLNLCELGPSQLTKLCYVLILERRLHEKRQLIELLGDEELINLVWDVFRPALRPLVAIYGGANNLGNLIDCLMEMLHGVIVAAEQQQPDEGSEERKRLQAFESVMHNLTSSLYLFTHNAAKTDRGMLREMSAFILEMCLCESSTTIDLVSLIEPHPHRHLLVHELLLLASPDPKQTRVQPHQRRSREFQRMLDEFRVALQNALFVERQWPPRGRHSTTGTTGVLAEFALHGLRRAAAPSTTA